MSHLFPPKVDIFPCHVTLVDGKSVKMEIGNSRLGDLLTKIVNIHELVVDMD